MKTLALLTLALPALAYSKPSQAFFHALNMVEASGRAGRIIGDGGEALGPLQIHRNYWKDSGVPGRYEDCRSYAYSVRVASAYLRRFAPRAWASNDLQTLARTHNGGPAGASNPATLRYWTILKRHLK